MGGERELVVDLVIIIGAAAGGGLIASVLRLPAILGYLVAGLIVENYIPGLDIDLSRLQDIAEIGVALLLFSLGVKFSFRKLSEVSRVALVGGSLQIVLTIGLGLLVGLALGLEVRAGLLIGYAMALSSTMVVLRLIEDRGELDALYGRIALGILLVQDLAVVLLVILIGGTAGEAGAGLVGEIALALGKGALLLAGAYVLGTRIVPWFLFRVASTGSRELFLLAVLSLALGLAGGSFALGLSVAFGAFLAGLVVSESQFSYQTLAEVLPLRDVFATVFFVAMGMLIDPAVLVDEPVQIAVITASLVAGKLVLVFGLVAALGYRARIALFAGLSLAQMGEFSFVLAQEALDERVISPELNSVVLMSALISIMLSPLLLRSGPRLAHYAAAFGPLAGLFAEPSPVLQGPVRELRQHVVVCGYGSVGQELVQSLTARDFPCLVVETDPYKVEAVRAMGVPSVYGDATNEAVLDACELNEARILAVTLPDPAAAHVVLQHAKRISPKLDVIVRGQSGDEHDVLLEEGATEVVHPEFEAGLEFVRHTLHRFGVDRVQIQALLSRRRRDFYHE